MRRKLKVYEVGDVFNGKAQPQIRLQGKWLREAGFKPRDRIIVKKEGMRLVIEHAR
jgi:hypothetical protein